MLTGRKHGRIARMITVAESNRRPWGRGNTIALAKSNCPTCGGLGIYATARGTEEPCACALREIFRICHKKFKACAAKEKSASTVRLERTSGGRGSHMYFSRKTEEYMADFTLICKRVLTEEEYKLFSGRYLLGADLSACARRFGMDRQLLFYHHNMFEQRLGRAFRETIPFPLFPLDEYFSDTMRGTRVAASTATAA